MLLAVRMYGEGGMIEFTSDHYRIFDKPGKDGRQFGQAKPGATLRKLHRCDPRRQSADTPIDDAQKCS